jgi:hypothetical protein
MSSRRNDKIWPNDVEQCQAVEAVSTHRIVPTVVAGRRGGMICGYEPDPFVRLIIQLL